MQTISPDVVTKLLDRVEALEKETFLIRQTLERLLGGQSHAATNSGAVEPTTSFESSEALIEYVNYLIAEWEANEDDDPKDSLRIAVLEGKLGLSIPVEELWDDIDVE